MGPEQLAVRRVVFVDLLRLVASFQMVQGHTLDALMAESHRSGAGFEVWTWTRGLTSVTFLFAAGLSFHLATLTRLDRHLGEPLAIRRRIERGVLLIALGYAMHLPDGPVVDVLQCIGLTLIALEGLSTLLRDARKVVVAAAAGAAALALLAPWTSTLAPEGGLAVLAHWITPRGGSIFPVVPWAAYVLGGVVCGAIVLPDGARTPRATTTRRLLALGAATVSLGLAMDALGVVGGGALLKVGAVMLLGGALALASSRVARLSPLWETLSSETLVLYLSHVVVLYAAGLGLAHVVGRTVPLPLALGLALVAIVLTGAFGIAWNRAKRAVTRRRSVLARTPGTG